ncbi:unnamed protein product [Linum trigynum]|uniref:Uncharacterized protein n=1 Tax=Linum trigynum TaxID=586398 RepID=A0AAV2E4U6_9ROSI
MFGVLSPSHREDPNSIVGEVGSVRQSSYGLDEWTFDSPSPGTTVMLKRGNGAKMEMSPKGRGAAKNDLSFWTDFGRRRIGIWSRVGGRGTIMSYRAYLVIAFWDQILKYLHVGRYF